MEDASSIIIHHKLLPPLVIAVVLSMFNARASSSSSFTTTTTTIIAITKPPRLVMKLIHRDSILSPYHQNPNDATSDNVRGSVIAGNKGSMFLVNISIGQPPVPQLVVMDSGSSLLWIQCSPCIKCHKQLNPLFDPSKSSTYRNITCISQYCKSDPQQNYCNSIGICTYYTNYVDETSTRGTLGMEEVRFMTSDEGTTIAPDTVIGCGHENSLPNPSSGFSGILGLGPHDLSLVKHIGSKFSYCIGNIEDPNYEYNQLIIGDGAKIEGYSTPIQVFRDKYYLTLESISVGEKRLDIDPETFRRGPSGVGGVIIDSGTTLIDLDRGGFDPLMAEVKNLIGGLLQQVTHPQYSRLDRLCYKGKVSQDLKGFPVITFHLAGDADLVLDVDAMFVQINYRFFCMAVTRASFESGLNVIGIRAQQYYNVGYDLDAMKLYFLRIDCQLLED